MSECICGADEPCPVICDRHNVVGHGYPCGECHQEWVAANPKTSAAIGRFASDAEMRAFVAGWFAHARNPKDAPLLVEDAWHAYRLLESTASERHD